MLVANGQPTLLPYLDSQPRSPDVINEVDMNGHSHASGYPVNGDAMDVRHLFLTQGADD